MCRLIIILWHFSNSPLYFGGLHWGHPKRRLATSKRDPFAVSFTAQILLWARDILAWITNLVEVVIQLQLRVEGLRYIRCRVVLCFPLGPLRWASWLLAFDFEDILVISIKVKTWGQVASGHLAVTLQASMVRDAGWPHPWFLWRQLFDEHRVLFLSSVTHVGWTRILVCGSRAVWASSTGLVIASGLIVGGDWVRCGPLVLMENLILILVSWWNWTVHFWVMISILDLRFRVCSWLSFSCQWRLTIIHEAGCDEWLDIFDLYALFVHVASDLLLKTLELVVLLCQLFFLCLEHRNHI